MWIYILNIILIVLNGVLIKNKKKYVIITSFQIFLILGLRNSNLGVDLSNYSQGYEFIGGLNLTTVLKSLHFFNTAELIYPFDYESGYTLLNWLIFKLNFSFHGFLIICALINISSFGYFIYKYSNKPMISFVILCTFGTFTYFFGILRQSLAISIFLIALHFAINKKNAKAILFSILAFEFHRSLVILIPSLFLVNIKKINKKYLTIGLLGTIPFLLLSKKIYVYMVYPIMNLFGKGYSGAGFQTNNLIILLYIINFLAVCFLDTNKTENKMQIISFILLIISLYVEIIGMYNDNFARILSVFNVFLLISIPCIISQYSKQKCNILIEFIMIILLFSYYIYDIKDSEIIPYRIQKNNIIFNRSQ